MDRAAVYRTIWRWHFYAGLFVMPMILILAITGSIYLFKPQVERWEERAWQDQPTSQSVSPTTQLQAALAAFPGAQFNSYRLSDQVGDAAKIHLALSDEVTMRDVFVSPQGVVLGSLDPEKRVEAITQSIHGQLLMGKYGSWIVELAASWAIVMILSGLFLWWPDGRGPAGVVWPRLNHDGKPVLRDLHAVTGFWVSGLAMILLLSGLPWADVWGSAFKTVRTEMGWVTGNQEWTIGGIANGKTSGHIEHDHATMLKMQSKKISLVSLDDVVAKAAAEHLAFPVTVSPPEATQRFGAYPAEAWTVKSESQNRTEQVTIKYDIATGKRLSREVFANKHPIDRVIGYGVAWHEGALFGWINQLVGLVTTLLLITMVVTGFLIWRKNKPKSAIGAPPLPAVPAKMGGVVAILLILAALLPMLAASLILLAIFDRFVLPRLPRIATWLGITNSA